MEGGTGRFDIGIWKGGSTRIAGDQHSYWFGLDRTVIYGTSGMAIHFFEFLTWSFNVLLLSGYLEC